MGVSHSSKTSFNPSTDIPNLKGKVILITGANSGLGKQSVLELSKHEPKEIWLASRQQSKAQEVIDEMREQGYNHALVKPLELDLASMDSVARAAATLEAQTHRLDILILNAGIMAVPPGTTHDGYEIQFGTNYLGHAFLVHRLLDLLVDTTARQPGSDVRVVLLGSVAHRYAPRGGIDFSCLKSRAEGISTVARYGQSKLAIILYARELAKRYRMLRVAVVHPGQVKTNLANTASATSIVMNMMWRLTSALIGVSLEVGVLNQLWAATADSVQSGEYYEPVGVVSRDRKHAREAELALALWDWTMQELNRYEDVSERRGSTD